MNKLYVVHTFYPVDSSGPQQQTECFRGCKSAAWHTGGLIELVTVPAACTPSHRPVAHSAPGDRPVCPRNWILNISKCRAGGRSHGGKTRAAPPCVTSWKCSMIQGPCVGPIETFPEGQAPWEHLIDPWLSLYNPFPGPEWATAGSHWHKSRGACWWYLVEAIKLF